MNTALLGKWLWRIGEELISLSKNVLVAKYNVRRNGWFIPDHYLGCSSMWRAIPSSKEPLACSIKLQIGNGGSMSFLHDTWIGDRPLPEQFPQLCTFARNRQPRVRGYMKRTSLEILWWPIFRRNLRESEEADLCSLLHVLYQLFILEGGNGSWLRTPSRDSRFTLTSFFSTLTTHAASGTRWDHLWKAKTPSRVLAFGWPTLHERILTMDNLCQRKVPIVNAFPMHLSDEESFDHLLLNCTVAHKLRNMLFAILNAAGSSLIPILTCLKLGCSLLAPRRKGFAAFIFPSNHLDYLEGKKPEMLWWQSLLFRGHYHKDENQCCSLGIYFSIALGRAIWLHHFTGGKWLSLRVLSSWFCLRFLFCIA